MRDAGRTGLAQPCDTLSKVSVQRPATPVESRRSVPMETGIIDPKRLGKKDRRRRMLGELC